MSTTWSMLVQVRSEAIGSDQTALLSRLQIPGKLCFFTSQQNSHFLLTSSFSFTLSSQDCAALAALLRKAHSIWNVAWQSERLGLDLVVRIAQHLIWTSMRLVLPMGSKGRLHRKVLAELPEDKGTLLRATLLLHSPCALSTGPTKPE